MADSTGIILQPLGNQNIGTDNVAIALGRSQEQLTTQVHGQYYSAAYSKNLYYLSTAAAGTTIPVQATNLAGTFVLLNPLTSSVNIELISYTLGITNATTVVADISLYFQTSVGNANAALSSTTALTTRSTFLNNAQTSQGLGYSAATFTNTVGTNFFRGPTVASFGAVTTTNPLPIKFSFDGAFILPPGTAITTAGSAAQTQAMTQTLVWAEWPV